jgi:uncharacterized membrane protein YagU involved in acid resistance
MAAVDASGQLSTCSKWPYRILTFLILPPAFLCFLRTTGEGLLVGWLIAAGSYVIMLSALAFVNQPSGQKYREVIKPVVRLLGVVVWSGFLAAVYFYLYYIIFDRENLFPQ